MCACIQASVRTIARWEATTAGELSASIRERVEGARQIQRERFRRTSIQSNAEMSTRHMRRYCELGPSSRRLLEHAVARLGLSARGYDRLLKIWKTRAEQSPDAKRAYQNLIFSYENSKKAVTGYRVGLVDPEIMARKRAFERTRRRASGGCLEGCSCRRSG